MWIEKITLEGLKSFPEKTIVDFVPGHNVIVGRNGSGKSNLLYAISFVLHPIVISSSERVHIINQKKRNAMVEVLLNNENRTLPIPDSHVRIRRNIGYKCDDFHVNSKKMSMKQVIELLETGGISSNNPYNYVRQGTITTLATSSSKSRLEILQRVAGISLYEKNKVSGSLKLEKITREMEDINDKISGLNDDILELQQQEADVKKFKTLEERHKELKHMILSLEYEETQTKVIEKKKELEKEKENQLKQVKVLKDIECKLSQVDEENDDIKLQEQTLAKRKEEYQKLLDSLNKDENNKSLLTADKVSHIEELEKLIIDEKLSTTEEKQLETLKVSFEKTERKLKEKDEEILVAKNELEMQEERMKNIFAKGNRKNAFKTPQERKEWFAKQLQKAEDDINMYSKTVEELSDQKEVLVRDIDEAKAQLQSYNTVLSKEEEKKNEILKEIAECQKQKYTHDLKKKENFQKRIEAQDNLKQAGDKLTEAENMLNRRYTKEKISGWKSIEQVLEYLKQHRKELHVCQGTYGILADCFTCSNNSLNIAVSAIAGQRIFNWVVKDKETATRLLYWKKELNLPGQVDFMPLNLIRPYKNDNPIPRNCIPFLDNLQVDQKYKNVVSYLFGSYILCKDNTQFGLVMASKYDGVTLDGDMSSRKGVLSGGYHGDGTSNRYAIYLQVKELRNKILDSQRFLKNIESIISDVESKHRKITEHIEEKLKKEQSLQKNIDTVVIKNNGLIEAFSYKEKTLDGLNLQISADSACIKKHKQRYIDLEEERDNINKSQRSQETEKMIELRETLKKDFKIKFEEGKKLQRERNEEKSLLEIGEKKIKDKNTLLNKYKMELDLCKTQVKTLQSEEKSLHEAILQLNEKLRLNHEAADKIMPSKNEVSKRSAILMQKKDEIENDMARITKILEIIQPILDSYNADIIRITEQITNLQFRPSSKSQIKASYKKLLAEKKKVKAELDKLSNIVNPAVLALLKQLQQDKSMFSKKYLKARKDEEAVKDLIERVDTFHEEITTSTYNQIGKYFEQIFSILIPGGKGKLRNEYEKSYSSLESSVDSLESQTRLAGISIDVCFNGKKKFQQMNSLSGGQKTMVALAFVYAIQRSFQSPIFIFDEVDAALDADRRNAVANYLKTICEMDTSDSLNRKTTPQFISTTFRKELLTSADTFIGVKFKNGVSNASTVNQNEAKNFIEHKPDFEENNCPKT